MKELWNRFQIFWTAFRAWKYNAYALYGTAAVAVVAAAMMIVLCASAPKGNDIPTLPTGGSANNGGTANNGGSNNNDGAGNNGSGINNDNTTNNGGSSSNGGTEADATAPTVDPDNVNNATGNTTTDAQSKLSFYKTSTHSAATTVSPGKTVTYSLVVTNEGSDSRTVTVTDEIPAVAEYVSGCDKVNGNQMKWELTLGAKESKTITYTLRAKDDEANLGKALDGTAKVNDTVVPFHKIYIERTLGNVDQGLMETAIDAFRQYTDLKDLNLLKMIWNVAISKSVSYNDANGNVMTPVQILKLVFTGEGSTSGSTGDGEEAASSAVDFSKAVIPTLYGGKGVTAAHTSKLHGVQAAKVTASDLMSGDAIFVQESESDTRGKIYIYNGRRLFQVGDGVINVNTEQVLNSLSNAYRYAGMRFSFVIANRKDFVEDRKDTYTEAQKVVIAMAEAYLLRGDRLQYDASTAMAPDKRYERGEYTPEDSTSDAWKYSNCSALTYDCVRFGLGYNCGNGSTTSISNAAQTQGIYFYEPTGTETDAQKKEAIDKFYAALQPADVIVIRRVNDSGHALLYIGDGKVIHSTGSSYKVPSSTILNGYELYEATVRYLNAYDFFDPKCDNGGNYSYYVFGGKVESIGIYRPLESFNGKIPTESVNRMNNLQGIAVEKVASKAAGQTVNVGEEITYTIKLLNATDAPRTLDITDMIPTGTTLVTASGAAVSGTNLSWKVTVPAGEKLEISYTVKVGNAVPDNKIVSKSAKVGGVSVRSSDLFVANTLTADQQKKITDAAKALTSSSKRGLELANEIYKNALGVEPFAHTDLSTFDTQLIEKVSGKYILMNTTYGAMAAPGLYGGRTFNCTDKGVHGRLSRLAREGHLVVGDIIFGKTSSANNLFIYLGDGVCWNLKTNQLDEVDINTRMERVLGYKNCWAVLRASMVLDI